LRLWRKREKFMFRKLVGAIVAVVIAGTVTAADAAPAGCSARASVPWAIGSGKTLIAEAMSDGPTCASAVVTLVVRNPSGQPIWVDSRIGSQVMIFAGVSNVRDMARALTDWIDQRRSTMPRADALPDWPQGAQAPKAGEFPFYPDGDVDRQTYMKLRSERRPLFCYVQGMESMACVALTSDGQMRKVGVQSFPG
jgi:hypothetical protein